MPQEKLPTRRGPGAAFDNFIEPNCVDRGRGPRSAMGIKDKLADGFLSYCCKIAA